MLRAIIVNIGTVAGVSAALLYQPQSELLEFAGDALSSGSDTAIEQGAENGATNTPDANNENQSPNNENSQGSNASNKPKKDKKKDGTPNPSSSSANPSPSGSSSNPEPSQSSTPTPTPSKSATPTPTPTPTKTKTPTPTPTPTSADGTYNGSRVDVFYVDGGTKRKSGTLKIQVIIKSGKVSDIVWTEYPSGEHLKYTNRAYAASAKPLVGLTVAELKSAKVATKTGATGTSTAFVSSLESVLQQL